MTDVGKTGGEFEGEALYRAAIDAAHDAILITDACIDPPGPRIVHANPAFERMTGYGADEVRGRSPRILQGEDTDRAVLDRLRAALVAGAPFEGRAVNYRRDGSPFEIEWRIAPVHGRDGGVHYFVAVQHDVTDQSRLYDALRSAANHDSLTGAWSRRAGEQQLAEETERARRHGQGLSVMLLDIDRFKRVNDTHGHRLGDAVLQQLTRRLARRLRQTDRLVRWGGEEFLVILPHTCEAEASGLADALRRHVAGATLPGGIHLTVSLGVAEWQPDEDPLTVVDRADRLLLQAKRAGRDGVGAASHPGR